MPRTQVVPEVHNEYAPHAEPTTGIDLPPAVCTRVDEDANQEDCPTGEPNTGIELPPVECTRVDEGELAYIAPITPTTPNNVPISPTPSDRRLTVNGTLSAFSGKGSVGDNEHVTPRCLYSTVLQTPSPANTASSTKPQRLLGCRPGPRCSKIYTPRYRSVGNSTRVPPASVTPRTSPVTYTPAGNANASYVSAIVMDACSPVAPSTVPRSEPRPETRNVYPVRVIRHENTFHKLTDWDLTDLQSRIILGDSNLCKIKTTPVNGLHVECFPGAKIQHLDRILSKYWVPSGMHPEYIILSVGINDRENNVNSTTIPAMRKLVARASKMFPGSIIVVPEINCSGNLTEREIRNVNSLNAELRRTPHIVCAPQLPREDFHCGDDNIHWKTTTGNAILAGWLTHLNC